VGRCGRAGVIAGSTGAVTSTGAVALVDQTLGLREADSILDPEFEITCAKVSDAANVSAESLFELNRVWVQLEVHQKRLRLRMHLNAGEVLQPPVGEVVLRVFFVTSSPSASMKASRFAKRSCRLWGEPAKY